MDKICFAGTFDPITLGHFWVVNEGLNFAENVVIYIAANNSKSPMFSPEERKNIIEQSLQEYFKDNSHRISVKIVEGEYTAEHAKEVDNIDYLIRGIRSTNDFDYENQLQQANRDVLFGPKTIFVMPPRDLGAVSSSFVKSFIGPKNWQNKIKQFIPSFAYQKILEKHLECVWFSIVKKTTESSLVIQKVIQHYNETHRHYHNLEHIIALLSEVQSLTELSVIEKQALSLSIIYHDVIYDIKNKNNEMDSAELFKKHFSSLNFFNPLEEYQNSIYNAIISTAHFFNNPNYSNNKIAQYLNNLDLCILGQKNHIYKEYCEKIYKEYQGFPSGERVKALQFLIKKVEENSLFTLEKFQKNYNHFSLQNMKEEIYNLSLNEIL